MNHQQYSSEDRIFDLFAARATEGLSPLEEAELEVLLVRFPEFEELDLEEAAAALDSVWQHSETESDELPSHIFERIANDAPRFICKPEPDAPVVAMTRFGNSRPRLRLPWATLGWIVAAACLLIAVWNRWTPSWTPTPEERLIGLVKTKSVDLKLREKGTPKYPDVQAEFFWSNEKQTGFVRLSGLDPNDPKDNQYQLWILDENRKDQVVDRVDGGVFDIGEDGSVTVPIDPKLRVFRPYGFAITREARGGTVQSDLSDVVVLAVADNKKA
ncbi:MAG: hypothetical protein ACFCD0_14310 [Gemmataceae bacterium]